MMYVIAFLAALAAGLINAVAGGGTLVSYPVLVALGIPPVMANVTNTIALCPGYLGGIVAQRRSFASQKKRLSAILPVCIVGGIIGGLLLLNSEERSFKILVPYLILFASLLLALQVPVKRWLQSRAEKRGAFQKSTIGAIMLLFLAAVYGGYFGAGVSVIVIATLGLIYDDSFTSLNVLKQAISFSINVSAACYFVFFGKVDWLIVLIMSGGSVAGGLIGGTMAGRLNPDILRWIVVTIGITVSFMYFLTW
ncbi:MAG: sulfite exporter TauE/SafE family protein [Methanomicrobiales archaeon HGW-Methanomicrobiales-4]|nr:MAG: sulfite exporter TauE/SafE family protein [Methanomicrobiales archaeon HGW-Methanomicrobiales-4]